MLARAMGDLARELTRRAADWQRAFRIDDGIRAVG